MLYTELLRKSYWSFSKFTSFGWYLNKWKIAKNDQNIKLVYFETFGRISLLFGRRIHNNGLD